MTFHKVAELVFSVVILLFLSAIVLGVLVVISVVQELGILNLDYKLQFLIIFCMTVLFVLTVKMIIDKIKDYNRYI